VRRLRAELHRIGKRDYFPPPQRATARAAVAELARNAPSDTDRIACAGSQRIERPT